MLHIFKLNSHRIAYDTATHRAYPLSALALKMLDSLTPPLTEDCPSALRYAFAKYDSNDLSTSYAELYALYKDGLLFAESNDTTVPEGDTDVVLTSAAAAVSKITSAIEAGAKKLHVYVKDATTCLASSLHEAFDSKAELRLILDLPADSLCDADIHAMNERNDVLWIPTAVESLQTAVQEAWDLGINAVHMELPVNENTPKALARLAKLCEAEEGSKEFFPFTEAITLLRGTGDLPATCSDCWARTICAGRALTDSDNTSLARQIRQTLIECAIILDCDI